MTVARASTARPAWCLKAGYRPDFRQKLGGLAPLTVSFYGPQSE
jgi:hypothetical protein